MNNQMDEVVPRNCNYSIWVNGDTIVYIVLRIGLRQGDPMSFYLFILCIEGLSSILKKREAKREIHGIKVCKGVLTLSYLLFDDVCFYFVGQMNKKPKF